ncbi:hypothetical protein D7Y41_08500 [Anaerotruncus sp. 1XD22-93]|nr:hypothetical protein [Lachnospiraceae bacterium]NBI74467.1 hypothetical protein [Lachnospiraceae bacterium]RKJ96115.1 hypothetical protein D7Y41_08500 [Anaerotruncus sp. 1XD22-93]
MSFADKLSKEQDDAKMYGTLHKRKLDEEIKCEISKIKSGCETRAMNGWGDYRYYKTMFYDSEGDATYYANQLEREFCKSEYGFKRVSFCAKKTRDCEGLPEIQIEGELIWREKKQEETSKKELILPVFMVLMLLYFIISNIKFTF